MSQAMIHYTLQDEPKKELYMYIVHLNQGNEITVKDIIKSFPVPGRFFLRFRTLIQDEKPPVTVWLDLPEEDAPVPFYKGTIYVKALQIPPFENRNLLKPIRKMYKTGVTQHQHNHRNHNTHVKAHEPIGKKPMNDFMDFGSDEVASKPFDLRSHSQDPPRPTMDVSQSHSATTLEDPTNGLSTEELKIRKEKFIQDQIKAKTETAKKTWEDEENQRANKKTAEKEFGEAINRWESRNMQKNNIVTLLSTLHTILWANAEWVRVSPGDLLTPKQVKMAYFKAIMIIHPDKHQNDPPNIKYISERAFAAVSEAYKKHKSS